MINLSLGKKTMRRIHIIITFLLIGEYVGFLRGQDLKFEYITPDNGLSHSSVNSIIQDKQGFIWISTMNGLNRYDGNNIVHYYHDDKNPESISDDLVGAIMQDHEGNLWISTEVGLSMYNSKLDKFINYIHNDSIPASLSGSRIINIYEDSKNRLWVASNGFGVNLLVDRENKKFEHFRSEKDKEASLSSDYVRVINEDKNGNIWFGTDGFGLNKLNTDNATFTHYVYNPADPTSLPNNTIYAMVNDMDGTTWIGTLGNGLCRMNIDNAGIVTFTDFESQANDIKRNKILTLFADKSKGIYIGTENGGLDYFNPRKNTFTNYHFVENDPNSLNNNSIHAIYKDESGNLWLGTYAGGLNVAKKNKKQIYCYRKGDNNSLSYNAVTCFYEDKKKNIWIGTDGGGLNLWDRTTGQMKHFNSKNSSLKSDAVLAICEDKEGNFWIGGWECALNKYNPKTGILTTYTHEKDGIPNNNIFDIQLDHTGVLWMAFGGLGIARFSQSDNTFDVITPKNSALNSEWVVNMTADLKGNLLLGTPNGFCSYNPVSKSLINYVNSKNDTNSLSANQVNDILVLSDSSIWIATVKGLNRLDPYTGKFKRFFVENGLPNNNITGMVEDDHGNIWISTAKGISKYNPKSGLFRNYAINDGLQGNDFIRNSRFKTSEGEILFGGTNGFNIFNPDSLYDNPHLPPVVITGFTIFNKPVKVGEAGSPLVKQISETREIILSYKQSVFSFDFAALDYTAPGQNQYAYMMEGFDKEWNYVGTKHTATYTNLNPGTYTFQVKGSNNDGVWNIEGAKIVIIIKPPFWQTWWFRSILFFTILFLLISFYLIRVKALKARQKHLEEVVDRRTKDLQTANLELKEQKEEILTQNEEILQQSEEIMAQRDTLEEQNKTISYSYRRIEMLSDFGQKLTSTLNISTINELLYGYVSNLIEMHAFGIGIYVESMNQIVFSNFIEEGKTVKPFSKDMSDPKSLTAHCFNNQKPMYINDITSEYSKYVDGINETSTSQTALSRIHIPLTVEQKRIGVFVVNSYKRNAYSSDDFANLKTLASYISIALDNANAYKLINDINKSVEESINYAHSIQSAFLPTKATLDKYFENFILFRPKDVVSGDFYWFSPIEKDPEKPLKAYLAAADCTGHGVPGALISIIGNNLLNEIVNIRKVENPAQILEFLNVEFQLALNQDQTRNNDGMDVVLYYIEEIEVTGKKAAKEDAKEYTLKFSGAKNPCIIFHANSGELELIKGSRKSIGGLRAKYSRQFYETKEFRLKTNDIIYLITDGFIDQLNKNKDRFSRSRFIEMIETHCNLSLEEQKVKFERLLERHQQGEKQTDDITILGIKL
jgi:ligand-binding sensor domain-containing protein/serine phosphatase RsbU (regulator of sigma subunit)